VLEYAKGIDPQSGWTTIKQGTSTGVNGEIAQWDVAQVAKSVDFTAPLVDHDQYSFTLRLRVDAKNAGGQAVHNEFRKSVGLYKDPTLLPGFPIRHKSSVEASAKIYDINGDGKDDLIQPTSDGIVHAYQADGSELAGWPALAPIRPELAGATAYANKACAYRTDKTGCIAQVTTRSSPSTVRTFWARPPLAIWTMTAKWKWSSRPTTVKSSPYTPTANR